MKEYTVRIKVATNRDDVNQSDIASAISKLLSEGLADAANTLEENEGDIKSAQLATDLNIYEPEAFRGSSNRVLVTVSGGVADYIQDAGLDVEVFDWDNYNADPEGTEPVPHHFADLAEGTDIPVQPAPSKTGGMKP